jgi:histidinol-phosphatase
VSNRSQAEVGSRLGVAHALLDETDRLALSAFGPQQRARSKPDRTLVTQTDTAIETHIRERLTDMYPADGVLGEEFGDAAGGDGRWIVDPIDATHNFVRGIPVFATLLAFERQGELLLGVVSAPALGRRWYALRGGGAFERAAARNRRIHVSRIDRLEEAQVVYGSLRYFDAPSVRRVVGVARAAWRDRGFGDFWGHMLVAAGSAEVMIDADLAPWDVAAPKIIVEEAGGRVTDLAGNSTWFGPTAISTNGPLHDVVLERLNR